MTDAFRGVVLGWIPGIASVTVAVLGCLVLIGWSLNHAILMSLVPGLVPMNPATALCFILAGSALGLLRSEQTGRGAARLLAHGCALGVTGVGLARSLAYLTGWDIGVDQFLFREQLATVANAPNRMAPNTAFNFVLVGAALLLLDVDTRRGRRPAQYLVLVAATVCLVADTGYAFSQGDLARIASHIPMALNTALAFTMLSVGILVARPNHGAMAVLTSSRLGGLAARRLLLTVAPVPWLLGWLRLQGERLGLYPTEIGVSIVAVATVVLLVVVLWWNARWLDAIDEERCRAEEARRQSESQLQAILDHAPALIYVKDPAGRLLFINRRCEEVFHIPREHALGKAYHDFFPGDVADVYCANDLQVLASRHPLEVEEPALHDDGIHTYVSVKFPLMDSRGAPYAVCGISTDITPRKRLEEALRESDERLNLALSSADVGTWSWLIPTNSVAWDDYLHPLFGLAPGMFPGRYEDFLQLLHPDDRDRVAQEVRNAIDADAPYDTEFRVIWPDGTVRAVGARGKVYRDAGLQPMRMTGVCWDITARKQAEERLQERTQQLEATNEALGSFTYSVSHDLRAPLRAIDGYARILLEDHTEHLNGDGREVLGVICENTRKMGRLIDDLLAFARLGKQELAKTRVDMTGLAQSVVEALRRLDPHRDIAVTVGSLVPAEADGNLMRQVLANLIGNAWKFTQGRSAATIEVGCMRGTGETTYFVADTGAGFEMEYAHKLFGVFQRLHRAEEFEGTGVGLAIVQRIVQRHGGRVWAEGAVNRGASFYFTLPAAGGSPHANSGRDTTRRG